MEEYKVLSSSVIVCDNLFYTKVSSAECIKSRLSKQKATCDLIRNIVIQEEDNKLISGIIITLCEAEKDLWGDNLKFYVDLIISDVLGTFISDRY